MLPHRSTARPRSRPSCSAPRRLVLLAALVPLLACGEADATGPEEAPARATPPADVAPLPRDVDAEKAVRDLITAVTPLAPDATAGSRNDWFANRKRTLERLRAAGEGVGRAALAAYHEREDGLTEVRVGLLDVAAHGVPAETVDLLRELVVEFGDDLMLRTAACGFLAETSPAVAVDVLEPILLERRHTTTYPPEDQMLAAWLAAKRALGEDPSDVLAAVATNLSEYADARHMAVRELAGTESPRGRRALKQLLVESGANTYVRRLAAQSLQKTLPEEEFCTELEAVAAREANIDFQLFLANMLERYCR